MLLKMWKSDVSQAYHQMPVSPYWQIRQVVTIKNQRHINRCNLFGGHGSLKVWSVFDCLVVWIAINKASVDLKFNYVDDDFGFATLGNVEWYEPYQKYFPTPQTCLLLLCNDLRIPHDLAKQLQGHTLPIIGFSVDLNTMTVTLPDDSKMRLVSSIDDFCLLAPGNRRCLLAEFQVFTGYANWSFNVYPLLKPALSNIYDKMAGKTDRFAGIYINAAVVRNLQWFKNHILKAPGVHFFDGKHLVPPPTLSRALSATSLPSRTRWGLVWGFISLGSDLGSTARCQPMLPQAPSSSLKHSQSVRLYTAHTSGGRQCYN